MIALTVAGIVTGEGLLVSVFGLVVSTGLLVDALRPRREAPDGTGDGTR